MNPKEVVHVTILATHGDCIMTYDNMIYKIYLYFSPIFSTKISLIHINTIYLFSIEEYN